MSGSTMKPAGAVRAMPLTQQLLPPRTDSLVSKLAGEMAERWRAGERPQAEEFLSRHPELCGQPDLVVRLIYEEICLRQEMGQEGASIEVVQRFPQWRQQLEDILCHPLPRGRSLPHFPALGESFGGFRLLAELGHGVRGRVYLASQPALADRPVVLKVTACDGGEHLSLARLQHTHIVPLYTVQDFLERNLRVLCMPYFGGATLAQILERLRGRSLDELSGQDLLAALDQAQQEGENGEFLKSEVMNSKSEKLASRSGGPLRQIVAQLPYSRAICWIGSCLADALEYAHERGLVHLDLKPSNVLLASDGQPMLLDFHLAQQPLYPDGPAPTWLGGTPAYMSPEQKAAIAAMRDRRPVHTSVDGRSDIYSLGVLLQEALGGSISGLSSVDKDFRSLAPSPLPLPRGERERGEEDFRNPPGIPSLSSNSRISPGLADMLRKCLQPQARDRYPRAGALAADLRRYLGDLPLVGVRNRSWSERWRKWRRRRPHALALVGIRLAFFAVVTMTAGGALLQMRHRYEDARHDLEKGQMQMAKGNWEMAIEILTRGLKLAGTVPFSSGLQRDLVGHVQLVREKQAAWNLHQVADQIRLNAVADSLPVHDLQELENSCREAWNSLPMMTTRLADLDGEDRQRLRADFLELAVLDADLLVRLAPKKNEWAARQSALHLLEQAETAFGPSLLLCHEQRVHAEALSLAEVIDDVKRKAARLPPPSAWEHCALGRSHLQSKNLDAAFGEFKEAVRLEPGGLWPNYYYGVCAYRLHRPTQALEGFSVCLGAVTRLTATSATPRTRSIQAQILYNRALAHEANGAIPEAIEDYDSVLNLDPDMGKAALNRGVLHFKRKDYDRAAADLNRALKNGAPPAIVHYNLALFYGAQKNREAALAHIRQALDQEPGNKDAQALLKQLTGK